MERFLLEVGNWLTLIIFLNIIGFYFFLDKIFHLFTNPTKKTSLNLSLFEKQESEELQQNKDWSQLNKEESYLRGAQQKIYHSILTEIKSEHNSGFLNAKSIYIEESNKLSKGINRTSYIGNIILILLIARTAVVIYLNPDLYLDPTVKQEILIKWCLFALSSVTAMWLLGALLKNMYRRKAIALSQFIQSLTEIKP